MGSEGPAVMTWTDATLTIDGVEWHFRATDEPIKPFLVRESYSATATVTVDEEQSKGWLAVMDEMERRLAARRQLFSRLWSRAWYGGRKGRRAWRRLLALLGMEVVR